MNGLLYYMRHTFFSMTIINNIVVLTHECFILYAPEDYLELYISEPLRPEPATNRSQSSWN